MKCRKCGREITEDIPSCPFCGQLIGQDFGVGKGFEWRSGLEIFGFPLIHVAVGRDANGKLRVAKGIIAIGQFAIGLITFAQFGVGLIFGLGQFMLGLVTIAQFAIGIVFGLGQFSTGYVAIGQVAFGWYTFCQFGFAEHMWSPRIKDPEAIEFFRHLWERIVGIFG